MYSSERTVHRPEAPKWCIKRLACTLAGLLEVAPAPARWRRMLRVLSSISRSAQPAPDHAACEMTMNKQNFVHDFQQKLLEMFRASPAADLERNIKALMGQTFSRLDLVSRDEFEIQVELLRALRTRVEALEEKLSADTTVSGTGSDSINP